MPLMGKIKSFARKPFYEKLNSLESRYHRLKTALFYKPAFGSMGRNCVLRRPILLRNPQFIHLGDSVQILDGVRLEAIVHNAVRVPNISIGNNVNIEQNVHIVCQSRIRIGNNVSITGNCAIVDTTHPYEDVSDPVKIGARILDEDSFVEIGDGSFLGYGSIILPNVRIGRHCIVGAHSCVNRDVPDYSVVAGNPAVILRRYDHQTETWHKLYSETSTSDRNF